MNDKLNERSLTSLCAALSYAMGIEAPKNAEPPCEELLKYVDEKFSGRKADRIFMYNPDAIAEWIYEKYPELLREATELTELQIPFCTVMPSVTPVCFGTMYTGAYPETHGIRKYEKPVITIDTIFDALIRSGKKAAIIAENECSLSKIYLERNMDYYIYGTIAEINAKAAELIIRDEYDFILVYNGNYDYTMHRNAPEGLASLCELRANSEAFAMFNALIKKHWSGHDTLVGFAMDHGCHEIDGGIGSHGLDMVEDLNIRHLYRAYPRED